MATFEVDGRDRVNLHAVEHAQQELERAHERLAAAEKNLLEMELHLAEADARRRKAGEEDPKRMAGFVHEKARCESNLKTAKLTHESAVAARCQCEAALERAKNPLVVREWGDISCLRLITCGLCSRKSGRAAHESSRADQALDMLSTTESNVEQHVDNPAAQFSEGTGGTGWV